MEYYAELQAYQGSVSSITSIESETHPFQSSYLQISFRISCS
jgi:hypothetical protein